MKRILTAFLVVSMLFGLAGCKSKNTVHYPNEDRGTNYQYDFVDFLDINVYGTNGQGILEVKQKTFNTDDFNDEAQYVQVKQLMDRLNLVYIPGGDNKKSNLMASKFNGISNGDVITIAVNNKADTSTNLSINLENYEFEVSGLSDGEVIDLFEDKSVLFFGLEGTNLVGSCKRTTSTLSAELYDNLVYKVALMDTASPLKEKETIVNVEAALKNEFLSDPANGYYTMDVYLKKHEYIAEVKTDTVLDLVVEPMEWKDSDRAHIEDILLFNYKDYAATTYRDTYYIDRLGNIQQSVNSTGEDRFRYTVTFHAVSAKGEEQAFRCSMRMYCVDGDYVVEDVAQMTREEINCLLNPISERYEIKEQFYYIDDYQPETE